MAAPARRNGPADGDTPGISQRQFRRIAAFIEARTGIRMPDSKVHLIEGRLLRRVRDSEVESIDDYCDAILAADPASPLVADFINAVTTNKTDFFREPAHFSYLAETILPALADAGRRTVRLWSAAASTGMEAYSIAMVLADFVAPRRDMDFAVLATDIDTRVLAVARRAIYALPDLAPVPPAMRAKYVAMPRDKTRKEARIVADLRRKVTFGPLNLIDHHYPVGEPMDVIFCRNVLIYFDKPTQREVVSRLCEVLRPDGHLILGHSESINGLDLPLTSIGNTMFRKRK